MILNTPENFDKNEWFILISILIVIALLLIIPRRLQLVPVLSLWLLNIWLAHAVDYTVIRPPINLYFSNDNPKYEIFDFLLYYFLFPSTMYLFLTGYASSRFLRTHWFFYVCCAAVATTGLEKAADLMQVFTYIHWSIWYSLLAYIPLYSINLGVYLFVKSKTINSC